MDVGERCFNLDFVKFMRGELWEGNKGEILKNCFPRLPRDLNLRFINHNGRKAVLLKKTSSRAATFPFPPFFAPLQTHPLGIRENDRSESSRLASNRKGRDNCGQRRCSTVRLLPPDSQLSACRMTNDVISTHLRHEHALDRLFSSRQEEFKCSVEREREREREHVQTTRSLV